MRWSKMVAVWFAVTTVLTFAAWQVVQAASNQVSEVPLAPVVAAGPTTEVPASTTVPTTTAASVATSTSTSTSTTSTSTTSTTAPAPPPGPATSSGSAIIPSAGGTVKVSYGNGQVFLVSATPAIGFGAEVDNQGPDEVRVEFVSDLEKIRVRVRWESGELVTEISAH